MSTACSVFVFYHSYSETGLIRSPNSFIGSDLVYGFLDPSAAARSGQDRPSISTIFIKYIYLGIG